MSFKDSRGVWITLGLFGDRVTTNDSGVAFETINDARKEFLELEDPTGYYFSQKFLGGYDHWKALRNTKGLQGDFEAWDDEMAVRLQAKGFEAIRTSAESNFQAAKLLLDRGWTKKREAGRPSKGEINQEVKRKAKEKISFLEDVKRIQR